MGSFPPMTVDSSGFDVERQRIAREVFTLRMRIRVLRSATFVVAMLLFLVLGGSVALRDATDRGSPWVSVLFFTSFLYLALWLADLPFSANGHRLDRRYGLSRQTWRGWALDGLKSLGLGLVFTLVGVEVLYWLLRTTPAGWWLAAWLLVLGVSFVAGVIAPVVLVRIFYKVTPLADADLEARLRALAQRAGIRVLGVHVVRTSAKSSRTNAALTGAGGTRRIALTDTLLQSHAPDEIETILAHELAHQMHRDPAVGFVEFATTTLATFAVLGALLPRAVGLFGLESIADPAGLPAMMLLAGALGFLFGPVEAGLSRRREARADRTALELTGKPEAFASAMVKLHDGNLSLARPPRLVEMLAMSHPAGWRRVAGARAFRGASP